MTECNSMDFPDTFEEFVKSYGIKDSKEVYTNGSVLIPVFRVKQWLDHVNHCEDRMKYVQETVNTMLNACTTNSIKDKVFRNAARFVQNAIDGQEPDFERIDEPKPCEDCVSRDSALKALCYACSVHQNGGKCSGCDGYNAILDLPPVTPKPRTGKWIDKKPNLQSPFAKMYWCDQCGAHAYKSAYCPGCGAKMEGESE